VLPIEASFVRQQIDVVLADIGADCVKTGMLRSAEVIETLVDALEALTPHLPVVVDPIMVSSSGEPLLDRGAVDTLKRALLVRTTVVTPNLPEAEALSGMRIEGAAAMREAARLIHRMGPRAVVIKGGHLGPDQAALDLLYDGQRYVEFSGERIGGGGAHGTGCAFSAAIAAWLARGVELEEAVRKAKEFVTRALKYAFQLGEGRRLLDHLRASEK